MVNTKPFNLGSQNVHHKKNLSFDQMMKDSAVVGSVKFVRIISLVKHGLFIAASFVRNIMVLE